MKSFSQCELFESMSMSYIFPFTHTIFNFIHQCLLVWGVYNNYFLILNISPDLLGFRGGSDSKESACNSESSGSIPGSGSSLGKGNGTSLQLPGEFHGQRSLAGYSLWVTGVTTEWLILSLFTRSFIFGNVIVDRVIFWNLILIICFEYTEMQLIFVD